MTDNGCWKEVKPKEVQKSASTIQFYKSDVEEWGRTLDPLRFCSRRMSMFYHLKSLPSSSKCWSTKQPFIWRMEELPFTAASTSSLPKPMSTNFGKLSLSGSVGIWLRTSFPAVGRSRTPFTAHKGGEENLKNYRSLFLICLLFRIYKLLKKIIANHIKRLID